MEGDIVTDHTELIAAARDNRPLAHHELVGLARRLADALESAQRPNDYDAGYAEGFHHGRSTPQELLPLTDAPRERLAQILHELLPRYVDVNTLADEILANFNAAKRPPLTNATRERLIDLIESNTDHTSGDWDAEDVADAILAEYAPVATSRERLIDLFTPFGRGIVEYPDRLADAVLASNAVEVEAPLRAEIDRMTALADGRHALGLAGIFAADVIGAEAVAVAKEDYLAEVEAKALAPILALHQPMPNSTSAMHPVPLCTADDGEWPCATYHAATSREGRL